MDGKNEIWNLPQNSPDIISRLFCSTHWQRLLVLKQQATITLVRSNLLPIGLREFVFGPGSVASGRHYITELLYCTVRCLTISPPDPSLGSSHLSLPMRWQNHCAVKNRAPQMCRSGPKVQYRPSAGLHSGHILVSICLFHVWQYCFWQTTTQTWTHSNSRVNLILSSDHTTTVSHSTGIPTFAPSDEHWQGRELIFKTGDGISRQYFP